MKKSKKYVLIAVVVVVGIIVWLLPNFETLKAAKRIGSAVQKIDLNSATAKKSCAAVLSANEDIFLARDTCQKRTWIFERKEKWIATQELPADLFGELGTTIAAISKKVLIILRADNKWGLQQFKLFYPDKDGKWVMGKEPKISLPSSRCDRLGIFTKRIVIKDQQILIRQASCAGEPGAVSLLEPNTDGNWIETATFNPKDSKNSEFGTDMSINGDRILILDSERQGSNCSYYIFERTSNGWKESVTTKRPYEIGGSDWDCPRKIHLFPSQGAPTLGFGGDFTSNERFVDGGYGGNALGDPDGDLIVRSTSRDCYGISMRAVFTELGFLSKRRFYHIFNHDDFSSTVTAAGTFAFGSSGNSIFAVDTAKIDFNENEQFKKFGCR